MKVDDFLLKTKPKEKSFMLMNKRKMRSFLKSPESHNQSIPMNPLNDKARFKFRCITNPFAKKISRNSIHCIDTSINPRLQIDAKGNLTGILRGIDGNDAIHDNDVTKARNMTQELQTLATNQSGKPCVGRNKKRNNELSCAQEAKKNVITTVKNDVNNNVIEVTQMANEKPRSVEDKTKQREIRQKKHRELPQLESVNKQTTERRGKHVSSDHQHGDRKLLPPVLTFKTFDKDAEHPNSDNLPLGGLTRVPTLVLPPIAPTRKLVNDFRKKQE